jgi:hypothetical protein
MFAMNILRPIIKILSRQPFARLGATELSSAMQRILTYVSEELITIRELKVSQRDPWQRVAQIALMLLMLMLAISPITQSIWEGDNILHGQDTETTLVLGLTLASIAILRMQRSKVAIDETLKALRDLISSLFGGCLLWLLAGLGHALFQPVSIPHSRGRPDRHTGYQLPLLI